MKKVLIGIGIVLLVLVGIFVKVNYLDNNKKHDTDEKKYIDNNVIHYYYGNYLFDIEINKDKLDVTRYNVIQCIQAPCNPIKDKMFSVTYKEEYKEVLEGLFKDDEKEVTLNYDNIGSYIYNVLLEIINEKDIISSDKYNIIEDVNSYDTKYMDRGYYFEELDNGNYLITIAMGERSTGGYSINITNVVIKDNNILIYVKEREPEQGSTVTMAFTYPIAKIELYFKPDNIEVENVDTFKDYEKLIMKDDSVR